MPTGAGDWIGVRLSGGRYRISAILGEGGMGAVYRARDAHLDTDVVIKVPHPQMLRDSEFAARFSREIRSLVKLSHPHVVKILDVGQYEDVPFAVMQYLPGGSLEDRRMMKSPDQPLPMSPQEIVDWLEDVAEALDFVHSQQYVHRDIKPGNILFDAHGNVFISDFGVAKATTQDLEGSRTSRLTGTGMVLGTPDYMAPEVVLGKPYDGRADQYALAVMLFELLCGRLPFVGPNPTAVLVAHSTQPVPDIREFCSQVSSSIADVVRRGLAKEPANRYPNCKTLAVAFRAALGQAGGMAAEMVVRQHCPICQQVLRITEKAAGRRVPCPGCKGLLEVSLDGREIAVAGPAPEVIPEVALAPRQGTGTKAMRSAGMATPQPLPSQTPAPAPAVPGRGISSKWMVIGGCASGAALILLGIAIAGLMRGGDGVATTRPTGAAPSDSKLAAVPGAPAPTPVPTAMPPEKTRPPEQAGKSRDENATKRPELARESEKPPELPKPQPKSPPPAQEHQLTIARNLSQHYEFNATQTPDSKVALARQVSDPTMLAQQAAEVRFVLLRLAIELYESAGSIDEAKRTREQLTAEFSVDVTSLSEKLLSRFKPSAPSGKIQLEIAGKLNEQYDLDKADSDKKKSDLAVQIYKDHPNPGAERFVALRLAMELVEEAGHADHAEAILKHLRDDFEMDVASLGPKLLPQIRRVKSDPLTDLLLEAMKTGDPKTAAEKLKGAKDLAPDDQRPEFVLGWLEKTNLKYDKAESHFRKCGGNTRDPDLKMRAWNNAALACLRQGDVPGVIVCLEKAVASGERSQEVLQNVGRLYRLFDLNPDTRLNSLRTRLKKLSSQTSAENANPNVGWLYMPLLGPDGKLLGGVTPEACHDPRCGACNGTGTLSCPRTVPGTKTETYVVPGTRQTAQRAKTASLPCPRCGGTGKLRCPCCDQGIEKGVHNGSDQGPAGVRDSNPADARTQPEMPPISADEMPQDAPPNRSLRQPDQRQ